MTPEARLDRLERIAKLLATAGYRARSELRVRVREHEMSARDHESKISHLVDLQIHNEQRHADNERRFERLTELQAHNERRFERLAELHANIAESHTNLTELHAELAQSQARTDDRLNSLIEIVRGDQGTNGS